jgi:hypothetical protein
VLAWTTTTAMEVDRSGNGHLAQTRPPGDPVALLEHARALLE